MKTAISMPDETFEAVTRKAQELGVSRSRLLVMAAEKFLAQDDDEALAAAIDEALERVGQPNPDHEFLRASRRRLVGADDW